MDFGLEMPLLDLVCIRWVLIGDESWEVVETGIMSVGREDEEWRGEGVGSTRTEGAEGVRSLESNVGQ